MSSNLDRNRIRLANILKAYDEISAALGAAGIEYAVLKGFTLVPKFCPDPVTRMQYDLDLVMTQDGALRARTALGALGFESLAALEDFPTDHLPAMIRKTGWEWRGDFFDPEIPTMLDLHFRFWDEHTERIQAPGVEDFWSRRTEVAAFGRRIPCLHPVDSLGYFCLHLLRHLLRGSVNFAHVYELAYFLNAHKDDEEFWKEWHALHSDELRQLESIGFALANAWFGCGMSSAARDAVSSLPERVQLWMENHAASPAEALFHPNKNELWLHLELLEAWPDKLSVLRRRLLPIRLPGPVDAVCLPDSMLTLRIRVRRTTKYLLYVGSRIAHHLLALPPLIRDGSGWWWRTNALGSGFWTLLGASALFSIGMFVFVVLFNLYLLDRGFNAQDLGWISSATTAGCIVGSLPAGILTRRFGLRNGIVFAFGGTALFSALRATVPDITALVLTSFLGGIVFAVWAVSLAPSIAGLTPESQRPKAFSVFFSVSIALGILGGWLAGHLPGWLAYAQPGASPQDLKQAALFVAAALVAIAVLPAARLRFQIATPATGTVYPRSRFIVAFLGVFAVWHLATGAFNPFFNAYFSAGRHVGTETIGTIFSVAQMMQIFALMISPILLRRLGLPNGVALMMAATGVGFAGLAVAQSAFAAAAAYAGYMAFQWMSEPGINALMMNRVKPEERSGLSALYYLVAFSAQAIAAAGAGAWINRAGFEPLLFTVSAIALFAALALRKLGSAPESEPSDRRMQEPQSIPESAA